MGAGRPCSYAWAMFTLRGVPPPSVPSVKRAIPYQQFEHYPKLSHISKHPTRWVFPSYMDNPGCAWLQSLKEMYSMPIVFPASLSPEAGWLLHGLIRNLRPRVVMEVGTFLSVSTHWIASALKENGDGGVIHCFDDFGPIHKGPWRDAEMLSGRQTWVTDRLTRAGLIDVVRFHPGNSTRTIVRAQDELRAAGGVQFAFIDGDHTYGGASQDLWATEPVLNTGGYVLLHDVFPDQCGCDGPRQVLDNINTIAVGLYEKIDLYLSPLNYGLGLMRRIG